MVFIPSKSCPRCYKAGLFAEGLSFLFGADGRLNVLNRDLNPRGASSSDALLKVAQPPGFFLAAGISTNRSAFQPPLPPLLMDHFSLSVTRQWRRE